MLFFRLILFVIFSLSNLSYANIIYVTNTDSKTLSVIDTDSNLVIATIPFPLGQGEPFAVTFTPDGKYAYVSGADVDRFDVATHTFLPPPITAAMTGDTAIGVSPDGKYVYFTQFLNNSVSVIDTSTNLVVVDDIPVGIFPINLSFTPDGKRVYIANQIGGTLSVIDTQTQTVVGSPISIGAPLGGFVTVAPNGKFAYASQRGLVHNGVAIIDTCTNQMVGSPIFTGGDPEQIAFTPNNKLAYVINRTSDSVAVIDTCTHSLIETIPIVTGSPTSHPFKIVITPDGKWAYITLRTVGGAPFSTSVVRINLKTNTVALPFITVGSNPAGIAITPGSPLPINCPGGFQQINDFGLFFEYYNVLTWQKPVFMGHIRGYNIYRNGRKIGSVGANTLSFQDHNQCRGPSSFYSITSLDSFGNESAPIDFRVNCSKKR